MGSMGEEALRGCDFRLGEVPGLCRSPFMLQAAALVSFRSEPGGYHGDYDTC